MVTSWKTGDMLRVVSLWKNTEYEPHLRHHGAVVEFLEQNGSAVYVRDPSRFYPHSLKFTRGSYFQLADGPW